MMIDGRRKVLLNDHEFTDCLALPLLSARKLLKKFAQALGFSFSLNAPRVWREDQVFSFCTVN